MRNVFYIFRREYLERVRSKAFIILTALLPLLFGAMFAVPILVMGRASKTQRLALVDLDGRIAPLIEQRLAEKPATPERPPVARSSSGSGAFLQDQYQIERIQIEPGQEAAVRARLISRIKNNELDAFLWIAPTIVEKGDGDYYARNLADITGWERIQRTVSSAVTQVRLVEKGVSADQVSDLLKRVDLRRLRITDKGEKEDSGIGGFLLPLFFTMALYVTLLIYGMAVMRSVIEEKTSRVFEVMLSYVKPVELIVG